MAVLNTTNLTEKIATRFIDETDIDLNFGLSVKPYEIISLVAPTGAGKTTLVCNLFAPLKKPILYFSLEESKETMAYRIIKCCGKDSLRYFKIIDQSDFISSKDDFQDILDTITDACANNKKYRYAAIIIDHLTCISSLKKHKNPINLLKQETVKHKIPLLIVNQYQTAGSCRESALAGGREMLFYATLSLELKKGLGKKKDITEEEQILYNVDLDELDEEAGIYTLDEKRNVKFKSDNLRLLTVGMKNRYNNAFKGILLDFDLENNRYIVFDKDAQYTDRQKQLIVKWNEVCAGIQHKDYYFDENNKTCYSIDKDIIGFVNNFIVTCDNKDESYTEDICCKLKQIFQNNEFYNSGIPEMKNLVYRIKNFIVKNTTYVCNENVQILRHFVLGEAR